jgi:hypothetical protein
MALQEPSVNLKEVTSTNNYSDDATDSAKSKDKRHSTHSHSSSDSDGTESTDDDLSIHVYNDAESLAETKSITRVESKAISRFATNRTGISVATTTDPNFEIDFEDGDPVDPHNWPLWYRCTVIFFVSYSTLTVYVFTDVVSLRTTLFLVEM